MLPAGRVVTPRGLRMAPPVCQSLGRSTSDPVALYPPSLRTLADRRTERGQSIPRREARAGQAGRQGQILRVCGTVMTFRGLGESPELRALSGAETKLGDNLEAISVTVRNDRHRNG